MDSGKLNDRVKEVNTAKAEAISGWQSFFDECREDWKFKMGDQWSDTDKTELSRKNLPMLSINHIFKNINLVKGYQRQNRSEMKVRPIEGSDEMTAEVLNMVIKWILVDRNVNFTISDGFGDAAIGGLGWLNPYLNYDKDPLNGDIIVKKVSPFNILPDPHFTERDLSDCDYIIRYQRVSKQKLKRLYPKYKDEIEQITGSLTRNDGISEDTLVPSDNGNVVNVVEYWNRVYEEVTMVVNTNDPEDMEMWDGSKGDLNEFLATNPDTTSIKMTKPVMKLAIVVEEKLLVYDGYSPLGGSDYPFIPIFCFYESSYSDWDLKLHGLVRPLKDLQREKNKRRSQIMQAINTMPHSGWIADRGAVDDRAELAKAAGAGRIIFKNPGKSLEPIRTPELPMALIQMETSSDNDIQIVGANPDMLGQMNERGAPGVTIQLRQKQGLIAIQEIFDSLSDAQRELGRRLVEMIVRNFPTEKIKRIIGDDFIYTKQIKELQAQLKELSQNVPIVPDIPIEVTPEDEEIHRQASPMAKQIMEEDIQNEREVQQEYAVQQQMMQVKQQMMLIQNEIAKIQAEEAEFWKNFEKVKNTGRFDISIDETAASPTYRASIRGDLMQMQQYGMPVPPEMMLDNMEIPKTVKDRYLKLIKEQQMMQAQMAQMQAAPKQQAGPQ